MEKAVEILKEYWGYDDFRGVQRDIIQSVMAGHDTLGLMPTGGGKSLTFQVPTMCQDGLCLVVTPLIALMKDQVRQLRQRNILAAAAHSGMSQDDIVRIYDNCILGGTKFLYISPERLESSLFLDKVRRMRVCLIAVDEAHCISQWGHDFRPAYLRILNIRKVLPSVPVLALTATATAQTVSDICRQLHFGNDAQVFNMSFERPNLSYSIVHAEDKEGMLINILRENQGCAIVYARSRDYCREIAMHLSESGVPALFYHAGLTSLDKDIRQSRWEQDEVRVMVATNAFGMGIDKSDVRLVIHMDIPDSLEAYFQETGRAGRDGQPSRTILLYGRNDITRLRRHINLEFPPKDFCRQIYEELSYFFQIPMGEGGGRTMEFSINMFCRNFRHYPAGVESALKLLTRAGYITYRDEDDSRSRLMMLMRRDDLYYLRTLTGKYDQLMCSILRLYSGLFSEYVYIDEAELAAATGLTPQEIYDILLDLTRQRVLNYIPHKNIPRITFESRRIETRHMVFPAEIYENRKKIYEQRIEAVLHFIGLEDDESRRRFMLDYFESPKVK